MADSKAQRQLVEMLRPLKEDLLHYAPRCLKIRTKDDGVKPLLFNTAQTYLHGRIAEQRARTGRVRVLVVKGRQQGVSTYVGARYYHRASMSFGVKAMVLTHAQASTDMLFGMTSRFHEHCPPALRPATETASAKELSFSDLDSGFMVGTAGSKATGRGGTIQLFHGSEVAYWPNAADHMAGVGQALPDAPGTESILESTGNGTGNLFYSMVMAAEAGKSDYEVVFIPWFWQAEYRRATPPGFVLDGYEADYARTYGCDAEQMAWRRAKLSTDFGGDVALFDQEYPATLAMAFTRVEGDPLILLDVVNKAMAPGAAGGTYGPRIMGLDPAEYGDDSSACVLRHGREVTHLKRWSKLGPMDLAGAVAYEADKLKPDMINVDATGVGSGVADRLRELGYPVTRVHFGERALRPELYVLRRDEMWGEMRSWFEEGGARLPNDQLLAVDLTTPQYSYDSSRRLRLESKESMRKRGAASPDSADALALTFASQYAKQESGQGSRQDWRSFRGG